MRDSFLIFRAVDSSGIHDAKKALQSLSKLTVGDIGGIDSRFDLSLPRRIFLKNVKDSFPQMVGIMELFHGKYTNIDKNNTDENFKTLNSLVGQLYKDATEMNVVDTPFIKSIITQLTQSIEAVFEKVIMEQMMKQMRQMKPSSKRVQAKEAEKQAREAKEAEKQAREAKEAEKQAWDKADAVMAELLEAELEAERIKKNKEKKREGKKKAKAVQPPITTSVPETFVPETFVPETFVPENVNQKMPVTVPKENPVREQPPALVQEAPLEDTQAARARKFVEEIVIAMNMVEPLFCNICFEVNCIPEKITEDPIFIPYGSMMYAPNPNSDLDMFLVMKGPNKQAVIYAMAKQLGIGKSKVSTLTLDDDMPITQYTIETSGSTMQLVRENYPPIDIHVLPENKNPGKGVGADDAGAADGQSGSGATPPAPVAPKRSNAIKIIDPETEQEIDMPVVEAEKKREDEWLKKIHRTLSIHEYAEKRMQEANRNKVYLQNKEKAKEAGIYSSKYKLISGIVLALLNDDEKGHPIHLGAWLKSQAKQPSNVKVPETALKSTKLHEFDSDDRVVYKCQEQPSILKGMYLKFINQPYSKMVDLNFNYDTPGVFYKYFSNWFKNLFYGREKFSWSSIAFLPFRGKEGEMQLHIWYTGEHALTEANEIIQIWNTVSSKATLE